MTYLETAAVYIAANMLLLLWLAVRVIGRRFKGRISIGDGGSEDLAKAIRTHGNAQEYIPAAMLALLALALLKAPLWQIHAFGCVFTLARILHPIGMSGGPLLLRQAGTVLTLTSYALFALALLVAAFT